MAQTNIPTIFSEMMLTAGDIYRKKIDAEFVNTYAELLDGVDLDAAALALRNLMKTSRFMPKPAEIRAEVKAMYEVNNAPKKAVKLSDIEARANQAWLSLIAKNTQAELMQLTETDPLIAKTVKNLNLPKRWLELTWQEREGLLMRFYREYVRLTYIEQLKKSQETTKCL